MAVKHYKETTVGLDEALFRLVGTLLCEMTQGDFDCVVDDIVKLAQARKTLWEIEENPYGR